MATPSSNPGLFNGEGIHVGRLFRDSMVSEVSDNLGRVCSFHALQGAEGTIFAAGGGELQWLNGVRFLYFEAHEGMAPGSEARTLAALLSHNMTVLAAPDERVSDHIYFACGRRSVADALCTATCMQWRASSRALQGMCAAVTDAATAGATYSSVWRRRVGRRRAQGERNR